MAGKGAPLGNQNASKGKRWAAALDKALKQFADKKLKVEMGQALDRIAKNVVKEAIHGDWWAVAEIANRLDGKPMVAVEVAGSIEHKHVHELTDEQLVTLATGGSIGTAEASDSPQDPTGIH
jgi:hypothetical protein